MMEHVSLRHENAARHWKICGLCLAALSGIASFAIFRSIGLSILIVVTLLLLTAWLDGLRRTVEQQMAELAVARAHLQKGEDAVAGRLSNDLAKHAKVRRVRNGALTTAAWAALKEGRPQQAKDAMDHIQPGNQVDLYCYALVEKALGKPRMAIEALELEASPNCESAMVLVDLYASRGRFDHAVAAAIARRRALGVDHCRTIVQAAVQAWALGPAASLAGKLFEETGAPQDAGALLRVLAHQREFAELDRTADEIVARLLSQRGLSVARAFLAELGADSALPSGACRQITRKLEALGLE
jgi:hypothetical protein